MALSGMATPPAKRQKRMIISDSDENNEDHTISDKIGTVRQIDVESTISFTSPQQKIGEPNKKTRISSSSTKRIAPVRHGQQNSGKNKPASLYAFFNTKTHDQTRKANKSRVQASIAITEEDDDDIRDDHSELDSCPTVLLEGGNRNFFSHGEHFSVASRSTGNEGGTKRSSDPKYLASAGSGPDSNSTVVSALSTAEDSRPWAAKYPPGNIDELAVHKKKIANVRTWLKNVLDGLNRQACDMAQDCPWVAHRADSV